MRHLAKLSRRLALAGTLAAAMLGPAPAGAQISPGPLARPHAQFEGATNCAKCHGLKREPMTQVCLSCHTEIQALRASQRGLHGGDATTARKECASCHPDHAGASFSLIAWDGDGGAERFDHRRAGWSLDGKHKDAKCDACHTAKFRLSPIASLSPRKTGAGWVGLDRDCASCHRGDDAHDGSLGRTCENCHDAKGWKPAPRFDHARSDYPLTGKHADVACDKCHRTARVSPRADAKGDRPTVFKPVAHRECSACHDDPHKGRLPAACGDCHVTTGFTKIDRGGFNHSLTKYPLEGKHRTARCEACHGEKMQVRAPAFATCGACHADAHGGEARVDGHATDCGECHTVRAFAPATFTVAQHAGTRFPLRGKHSAVRCSLCHTPAAATPVGTPARQVRLRVAFGRCADCHGDAHGGQLAGRAGNGACESCHGEHGWTPSTFDAAAHARLRLPLTGRHAAVACAACHALVRPGLPEHGKPVAGFGTAKVALTIGETTCASCHADPHGGRYGERDASRALTLDGGCAACHGTQAFRPALVDAALHARFAFPLEGAHLATPCVACHVELRAKAATRTLVRDAKGIVPLPFAGARRTACASCHDTPHGTQFATRANGACEGCHTAAAFAPATRFDHERDAAFSLKGAHARVPCASCHRAPVPGAPKPVVYRGLSARCESCHAGRPTGGIP